MNKEKVKQYKEKLSDFLQKVKDFKITKYLLDRKEEKLVDQIQTKKDLIEFHVGQIVIDEEHITSTECEITILKKDIKQLEADVKKIVKVINLYIV